MAQYQGLNCGPVLFVTWHSISSVQLFQLSAMLNPCKIYFMEGNVQNFYASHEVGLHEHNAPGRQDK